MMVCTLSHIPPSRSLLVVNRMMSVQRVSVPFVARDATFDDRGIQVDDDDDDLVARKSLKPPCNFDRSVDDHTSTYFGEIVIHGELALRNLDNPAPFKLRSSMT
jgi:hypothetical protein